MCGVLPTTFGSNWTKLIFSRQFPKEFVLLWDAVYAMGFELIECIFVAMVRMRTSGADQKVFRLDFCLFFRSLQSVPCCCPAM